MRRFSGWGGCAEAFGDKPEWKDIHDDLEALLTPDQYAQARGSTLTAYYTPGPVVKAMWDGLARRPHADGPLQVLEPGCGTGNFLSTPPRDMDVRLTGVELDPVSARIASLLNPQAQVVNADLSACLIPEGSFDMAVGNVPYSGDISIDYKLLDGTTTRLALHDYFIERTVDALRPGGTAMLLTSRHTLDKRSETMRSDLARKAELAAVVRLPSSTFGRQAGTQAVTDVLVLRKRGRTLDHVPDEPWVHSAPMEVTGYRDVTVNVNRMVASGFDAHAVGVIQPVLGRYGGDFDVTFDGDANELGRMLAERLDAQLPATRMEPPDTVLGKPLPTAEVMVRPDHATPFEYTVDERGVVWYGDDQTVVEAAHGDGDDAERLRGMIRLRDLARELQALELDPAHAGVDPQVEDKRRQLDQAYEAFASRFGRLCGRRNRRAYESEEAGRHLVMALEETDEQGRFVGKARCFTQRTISPPAPMPEHVADLSDALDVSLDRTGRVDLELIARLADTTPQEAETGLGDRIVRDPDTGTPVPADDYLTGDVVAKLAHVRSLAHGLRTSAATEVTRTWLDTVGGPATVGDPHEAKTWIDAVGGDTWDSMSDPYGARSYRDPQPAMRLLASGYSNWSMQWEHNPGLVLALASRALEELPEGSRLTHKAGPDGRVDGPDRAPSWNDRRGNGPLWDALCWNTEMSWRFYQPVFAAYNMPLHAMAAFVHKLAHAANVSVEDRTAILANLFECHLTGNAVDGRKLVDSTLGAMVRRMLPDVTDPRELARRVAGDPAVSEWLWARISGLPQDTLQSSGGFLAAPRSIDPDVDGWNEFRRRRNEFMAAWMADPAHAEASARDVESADRLDHLAGLVEKAQPVRLEPEQIKAPLGAPWIPAKDVFDFMMSEFEVWDQGLTDGKLARFRVDWMPELGQWRVGYSASSDLDYGAKQTYGTEDRNPCQLLEACLNNAQITVTKESPTETTKDGKPRRVKDAKATMAAVGKADAIRAAWDKWVFADPARRDRLTSLYNGRFNNLRPRHVDGSYLTLPGMADGISLRQHQKDAVARALRSDEGTLIAHVVGAGKTYEGITLVREAKRLGKASKPMLVVPNHLVDQWAGDVLRLYPASRILVMDKDAQRGPESVRRFWGRVMTGDWDAVIVPESRFSQLHVSRERRVKGMQERVDEFVAAIAAAAEKKGAKDPTVKRLEAARKTAEQNMKRLREGKESKDDQALAGIEFEQLGVDMLVVDEAHHFKNLGVPVASADLGMQLTGAAKCEDLLDKCKWLRENGHGDNIAFMTGTPVTNSMSELYNMQRYLAPRTLEAQGLGTFAAWAGAYGRVVPTVELKPEGNGFQVRQRFARFQNLPELMSAVKQFTDMVTNDQLDLDLPELTLKPVPVPIGDGQKTLMGELSDRADRVRDGDVTPETDNLLKITSDGRKIALDPKLLKGHEDDRPLEHGKVQACAENVARIWRDETEHRGAQLVFCDSSTPASGKWNAYQDLKDRLVRLGVPADEVAFVHDAGDDPAKRERLFVKVRSGQIRVLVGSTQKLGTGTNVQERLCAIHDLDCPWRPADLEQRLGRILRQGNTYGQVSDFRYVTEGTFDAYSYQTVERKQRFISQLMSSKSPAREAADLDADVVTLANIKALATGDPDIQRRMTLENEVNQLMLLRAAWAQQKADVRQDIEMMLRPTVDTLRETILENEDDKPLASKARSIHATAKANGTWEGMTVMGAPVGDRRTACRLLDQAIHRARDGQKIGEYDGLDVIVHRQASTGKTWLTVKAVHEHDAGGPVPGPLETGVRSIVAQLDRLIKNTATGGDRLTERLAKAEAELKAAQETLDEPFAQEKEYQAKLAELKAMGSNPGSVERQHIGDTGTNPRQQEGTIMDAKNPIPKHGWIVLDPPVTHSYEDITGDPKDKDDINQLEIDRYQNTGRIGILAYKDGDEWDRMWGDLTVNKPDIPLPENTFLINENSRSLSRELRQAGWIEPVEDAPGVWKLTDKAIGRIQLDDPTPTLDETDETIPAQPAPEAYAFRWHNATGPGWHTEYHPTEEQRDQAMQEKKDTGHLTQPILEDPAVLYEEHRKTTCASTALRLADAQPSAETTALLRDLVDKVLQWRPDDEIGHLKTYQSADAIEQAGQGLSPEDIKEKQAYGGWDPKRDELMRIDEQGDWQGLSQSEADRLLWDHRSDILDAASRDDMLPLEDVERIGRADAQAETGQERDQPTEERDAPEREQPAQDEPEQEEPEQEEPEPRRGLHM